jgi:toxin ParE2
VNVRLLSIAELELDEAIAYYKNKENGLGLRLFSEVNNSIKRILAYPDAWNQISHNTRRCRTNIFPFGIIYQTRDTEILIVAIASLHREPDYWKDRI